MKIAYLFSSPGQDIYLRSEDLKRPFLLAPSRTHPFLSLCDYFRAIEDFLLRHRSALGPLFQEHLNRDLSFDKVQKISIRSEKHGAYYHLASVEFFFRKTSLKFAVSTALSEKGKIRIDHEYKTLSYLHKRFESPSLPRPYLRGEQLFNRNGNTELFTFLLAEWFEGYHEWHLSYDEQNKREWVCIWDMKSGNRFATKGEGLLLFRKISNILTLFYDTHGFEQVYPWHHEAGDFVIKNVSGDIDVKLTTARTYEPLVIFTESDSINPTVALLYFFLNLSIRIRLDKLNGVGEWAWAGAALLEAAVEGFFDAIRLMHANGRYHLGGPEQFLSLLKSLSLEELLKLTNPLMDLYKTDDPSVLFMIRSHLREHSAEVLHIIGSIHL